jgi:STE24 endopeptidase
MLAHHALFLLLLGGTPLFFTWLDVTNLRYSERMVAERADWIRERFDVDDPGEIIEYDRARTGVSQLRSWTTLALLLAVLYAGAFGDAVAALEATGLPLLVRAAVFFAGGAVALTLVGKPFDAYATFVVEELFDFNEQTPALFVRDTVVSLVVVTVVAGVLGTALVAVVREFPDVWALGGALVVLAFMLLFQVVYPRVIAPLFNDFDPIDSGDLRDAVDAVFDRAGFECEQLYEMDASRRSSKSNAYFIGFGRAKRVVLYDTLVEDMSLAEVQAVLAHELAHWKKHHVWILMAAVTVQMGALFAVAQYLLDTGLVYEMFGVPAGATYAGLALALLWAYPLLQLTAPLQNKLSLRHERAADDFGATNAGADAMASALSTLGGENLANPFPHPLYETFHHDHPPIPERIRRLEEGESAAAASGGEEGGTPA